MADLDSGLVDIARDFLAAQEMAGEVAARYRQGELTFAELERFVEDGERSPLFRLKERCHALFRGSDADTSPEASREQLFDLAVGALFHEAMKLRENFYQQAVYGPKVFALRGRADADAADLFDEFEKILGATSVRLEEALQETLALLHQTRRQFRGLLAAHRGNGLPTRFLVENAASVEAVFEEGLDALLAEIHGGASAGYLAAARSYLESGFLAEADDALARARALPDAPPDLEPLQAYTTGMRAHIEGRSAEAVERLEAWLATHPEANEALTRPARAAAERIAQQPDAGAPGLSKRASELAASLAGGA